MKLTQYILSFVIISILFGCKPSLLTKIDNHSHKSISSNSGVLVIQPNESLPKKSNFIGKVTIGEISTKMFSYEEIINHGKAEARKYGGNILNLTEIRPPNSKNTNYIIKSDIYFNSNIESFIKIQQIEQDSITKSKFPKNPNYAIVYAYRPIDYQGVATGYKLNLGDSLIGKIYGKCKYEIIIYKEGLNTFSAETESKEILNVNIKFGEEYYLQCGLKLGMFVGLPNLSLIDKKRGRVECSNI